MFFISAIATIAVALIAAMARVAVELIKAMMSPEMPWWIKLVVDARRSSRKPQPPKQINRTRQKSQCPKRRF